MHPFYREFKALLNSEDRERCVHAVLSYLADPGIGIVELYDEVLAPAVNAPPSNTDNETIIWREHIRTSIVRTIVECCYPRVLDEKDAAYGPGFRGKVIIACPAEEYHDLGARMVSDFFTLCGYDVTFIGANTPREEIAVAIRHIRPVYVGIGVSNYYHLVSADKLVKMLSAMRSEQGVDFRIIVGGSAFERNPVFYEKMGADMLLHTFEDIKRLSEEDTR